MDSTGPWPDVRLHGFATRSELAAAQARLDAMLPRAATESVPLANAQGRTLAEPVLAASDLPPTPRARIDGFALAAAATFGASAYNPLELSLTGGAYLVAAGEPMPPGTNAVLPFAAATINGGMLEIEEPVAPGDGVETAGAAWRRGDTIAPAGRRLTAFDRARAAEAGLEGVEVFRRPAVRIIVPGPKGRQGSADALLLMPDGLIERDGGFASAAAPAPEIATALRDTGAADLVLIAGRSGSGADDEAAPALAAVGQVDVHGVAIAPGGSAGLGRIGGVPVVLLPGEPLACLAAYELLAGRAVRQLAGLPARLPHPRRRLPLSAKVASQVGVTELWLVRRDGDGVAPLAPPDRAVLATTAAAMGFVLVPSESEGHQVGTEVEVHLFDRDHV